MELNFIFRYQHPTNPNHVNNGDLFYVMEESVWGYGEDERLCFYVRMEDGSRGLAFLEELIPFGFGTFESVRGKNIVETEDV